MEKTHKVIRKNGTSVRVSVMGDEKFCKEYLNKKVSADQKINFQIVKNENYIPKYVAPLKPVSQPDEENPEN